MRYYVFTFCLKIISKSNPTPPNTVRMRLVTVSVTLGLVAAWLQQPVTEKAIAGKRKISVRVKIPQYTAAVFSLCALMHSLKGNADGRINWQALLGNLSRLYPAFFSKFGRFSAVFFISFPPLLPRTLCCNPTGFNRECRHYSLKVAQYKAWQTFSTVTV